MCLYPVNEKTTTAEQPIKCYKVVKKRVDDINGEIKYLSYYAFAGELRYVPGETIVDKNPFSKGTLLEDHVIESGIHVFSAQADATRTLYEYAVKRRDDFRKHLEKCVSALERSWWIYKACDIAVLECEIPAGARYYEGESNCFAPSRGADQHGYVCDRLYVVRELTREEIGKMPYVEIEYEPIEAE